MATLGDLTLDKNKKVKLYVVFWALAGGFLAAYGAALYLDHAQGQYYTLRGLIGTLVIGLLASLWNTVSATPAGGGAAGAAGGGQSVFGNLFNSVIDGFSKVGGSFVDTVMSGGGGFWGGVKNLGNAGLDGVKSGFGGVWGGVKNVAGAGLGAFSNAGNGVIDWVKKGGSNLIDWGTGAGPGTVRSGLGWALGGALGGIGDGLGWAWGKLPSTSGKRVKITVTVLDSVTNNPIPGVQIRIIPNKDFFVTGSLKRAMFQSEVKGMTDAAGVYIHKDAYANTMYNIKADINNYTPGRIKKLGPLYEDEEVGISLTKITGTPPPPGSPGEDAEKRLIDEMTRLIRGLGDRMGGGFEGLTSSLSDIANLLSSYTPPGPGGGGGVPPPVPPDMSELIETIKEAISEGLSGTTPTEVDTSSITEALGRIESEIGRIGAHEGTTDAIEAATTRLETAISGVMDAIVSRDDSIRPITEGMDRIESTLGKLSDTVSRLTETVEGGITDPHVGEILEEVRTITGILEEGVDPETTPSEIIEAITRVGGDIREAIEGISSTGGGGKTVNITKTSVDNSVTKIIKKCKKGARLKKRKKKYKKLKKKIKKLQESNEDLSKKIDDLKESTEKADKEMLDKMHQHMADVMEAIRNIGTPGTIIIDRDPKEITTIVNNTNNIITLLGQFIEHITAMPAEHKKAAIKLIDQSINVMDNSSITVDARTTIKNKLTEVRTVVDNRTVNEVTNVNIQAILDAHITEIHALIAQLNITGKKQEKVTDDLITFNANAIKQTLWHASLVNTCLIEAIGNKDEDKIKACQINIYNMQKQAHSITMLSSEVQRAIILYMDIVNRFVGDHGLDIRLKIDANTYSAIKQKQLVEYKPSGLKRLGSQAVRTFVDLVNALKAARKKEVKLIEEVQKDAEELIDGAELSIEELQDVITDLSTAVGAEKDFEKKLNILGKTLERAETSKAFRCKSLLDYEVTAMMKALRKSIKGQGIAGSDWFAKGGMQSILDKVESDHKVFDKVLNLTRKQAEEFRDVLKAKYKSENIFRTRGQIPTKASTVIRNVVQPMIQVSINVKKIEKLIKEDMKAGETAIVEALLDIKTAKKPDVAAKQALNKVRTFVRYHSRLTNHIEDSVREMKNLYTQVTKWEKYLLDPISEYTSDPKAYRTKIMASK